MLPETLLVSGLDTRCGDNGHVVLEVRVVMAVFLVVGDILQDVVEVFLTVLFIV